MKVIRAAWMLLAAVAFAGPSVAARLDGGVYHVTLHTGRFGPLEMQLRFEERQGVVRARSLSGAHGEVQALPGARRPGVDVSAALFALDAKAGPDGYSGALSAPWPGAEVSFSVTGGRLRGSIRGGPLRGSFEGVPTEEVRRIRDYPSLLPVFDAVVRAKIFDPDDLEAGAFRLFRERLSRIAGAARDDVDFVVGFHLGWTNEPFSHFELRRSAESAEAMIRHFDGLRVGERAARVEFDGDLAVLRVDTMMGNDTVEQVEAAYEEVARRGSRALVVDLRRNEGGAFAVKPLVEHIIDAPLDAGYFVSQKWNATHDRLPTADELAAVAPWTGWSISAFWRSVQDVALLRIRMEPAQPNFDGPVFVVVDGRSASATELAADAFRASGLATLVGEKTVGHMLSQSFFDVAQGFVVSLPVADYCSAKHGRIEGVGVPVHVQAPSEGALERAKTLARAALGER